MRRLLSLVLAIAAMSALWMSPAGAVASPYTKADTVRDVAPGGGDVTEIKVTLDPAGSEDLRLRFATRNSLNPYLSAAWQNAPSQPTWFLDTNAAEAGAEFKVFVVCSGGGCTGEMRAISGNDYVCAPTFNYTDGRYVLKVFAGCFSSTPSSIRVRLEHHLEIPSGPSTTDKAPNSGWSPLITD